MRPDLIHLTADGVSVLLDLRGRHLPAIVHWGAALGPIDPADATAIALTDVRPRAPSSPDDPVRLAVLPEQHTGWLGRPGLSGSRDGESWSPWFQVTEARAGTADADGMITLVGGGRVEVEARDDTAQLGLELVIELSAAGVLRASATLSARTCGSTASTTDPRGDLEYDGARSEPTAAATVFQEIDNRRAISAFDNPSDRYNLRISAQSSTEITLHV